jgi:hydroxylamine reductase
MFCNQCEETAKGFGCTVRGVCGKDEETAGLQDVLIYVLTRTPGGSSGDASLRP